MKGTYGVAAPGVAAGTAPRRGQLVGERYRLEEWLESGAMGNIWRATQVRLRSAAAIKFLDPSLIEVPEMLERFLQEARSAAAVQSAHVIQVFDFGSHGGLPYIAMELLQGENLATRLATRGALSPTELDKIFSEVARGLGQAHALGVIHRDVKPGNIFLAREGNHEVTKLIDFGIAKVKADALRASQIVGTDLGMVLGTPQYMSPEQMRGWSSLDHRTDLWALAVIACECLTGRCPFSGSTLADLTVQICTEEPLAPSALGPVPPGFDEWFFRGTRKDPRERFDSASEMADALASVLAPITVRQRRRRLAPLGGELRQTWAAAYRRMRRLSGAALAGAAETISRCAALVQSTARGMSRAVSGQPLRPVTWRRLGIASAGLALLVVVSSLAPDRDRGASPLPSSEVRSALPARALPRESAPLPAASARAAAVAPPVVSAEQLPLAPATQVRAERALPAARSAETQRQGKKPGSAVQSEERADSTPSSPMSEAMVRLGALMAQGGGDAQLAPAKKASGPGAKGAPNKAAAGTASPNKAAPGTASPSRAAPNAPAASKPAPAQAAPRMTK